MGIRVSNSILYGSTDKTNGDVYVYNNVLGQAESSCLIVNNNISNMSGGPYLLSTTIATFKDINKLRAIPLSIPTNTGSRAVFCYGQKYYIVDMTTGDVYRGHFGSDAVLEFNAGASFSRCCLVAEDILFAVKTTSGSGGGIESYKIDVNEQTCDLIYEKTMPVTYEEETYNYMSNIQISYVLASTNPRIVLLNRLHTTSYIPTSKACVNVIIFDIDGDVLLDSYEALDYLIDPYVAVLPWQKARIIDTTILHALPYYQSTTNCGFIIYVDVSSLEFSIYDIPYYLSSGECPYGHWSDLEITGVDRNNNKLYFYHKDYCFDPDLNPLASAHVIGEFSLTNKSINYLSGSTINFSGGVFVGNDIDYMFRYDTDTMDVYTLNKTKMFEIPKFTNPLSYDHQNFVVQVDSLENRFWIYNRDTGELDGYESDGSKRSITITGLPETTPTYFRIFLFSKVAIGYWFFGGSVSAYMLIKDD